MLPASQAYIECIFSLCGMLTAGCQNRLKPSLEMACSLSLTRADVEVCEQLADVLRFRCYAGFDERSL